MSGVFIPIAAADAVCPMCEAPLEPGAAFCVRCGHKLEQPATPETALSDERNAVVQVVTVHDTELTSTYGSLVYESNLRVDSILGSAFAIAPGEFVTDCGLLIGAKEVLLRTVTGRSVPAKVIGSDTMIGVALLNADLPEITPLTLREDEPPRAGESLKALGYSIGARAGGEPILSAGVVSGLHRTGLRIHPIEDYFQTDASLPRGLAGGPMVDSDGRVVGMSTGLVLGSRVDLGQSGIGYAVRADPERRERYDLPAQVRLLIDQVFPGSPAAAAGLRRGDGLLKVQDEEITTLTRLQHRLLTTRPYDSVAVEVTRAGGPLKLSLTAALRPARPRLSGIDALRFFGNLELDSKDGKRLVVASITPGSALARLKVVPGDVLRSVLSKKDWTHGAKDNARWRRVRTVAELETRMETAYSDLDFFLGLRFRSHDGEKRELFLWEILTPTAAL
jgi:S1-C subfamily serine protease